MEKKAPKCTVFNNIYNSNENCLNATALYYYGKKFTYKDLFDNVEQARKSFVSMGVKKGDNVAFLTLSCPEMVHAILALNSVGAVANMVNPTFTAEQMRNRINDAEAKMVIILDQLYDRLTPVMEEICSDWKIIIPIDNSMPVHIRMLVHQNLKKSILYNEHIISWKTFLDKGKNTSSYVIRDEQENLPAIMVYSSGTTGASKGIVLTNHGINHTISYYDKEDYSINPSDKFLHIGAPWFSTFIITCLFMPLQKGISVVIEPVFSADKFLKAIKKYKPTMCLGSASFWIYVMENLKDTKVDLSYLRYPITGGEKVLDDTEIAIDKFLKEHKSPSRLLIGYGMCELGSTVCSNTLFHYRKGAVGFPIKDVVVAAFDLDSNKECRYRERGEIRVISPARMKEYYKRQDATAEYIWKDENGREWGCTGDVGYVDEEGFVYVEGRAMDYFTTISGDRIYNFDIENVILEVENVYQCEVVGRKKKDDSEEPVAFVVLSEKETQSKTLKSIRELCERRLSREQIPVAIQVIDEFPVKPSGKRDMEQLSKIAAEL